MSTRLPARASCLVLLLALSSCAKNVGDRLGIVIDDQKRFAAMLSISPVDAPSILAKASSVSSTVLYSGNDSNTILEKGVKVARELGYTLDRTPTSKDSLIHLLCHQIESGRSLIIGQQHGNISVNFRVSGWPRDRKECPGQ